LRVGVVDQWLDLDAPGTPSSQEFVARFIVKTGTEFEGKSWAAKTIFFIYSNGLG